MSSMRLGINNFKVSFFTLSKFRFLVPLIYYYIGGGKVGYSFIIPFHSPYVAVFEI